MKVADARYVEVTLEEMESFLKRAFRALRPRRNKGRGGEVTFDLSLSDNHSILVRVYTSIYPGTGMGRGKGADSIKVVMLTDKGKPLMPAGKIVMRTKNWRTAIQDRIEDYLETYESKVEYWKQRRLERNEGQAPVREDALDEAIRESLPPPAADEPRDFEQDPPSEPPPAPSLPPAKQEPFEAAYKSLPGGGWGIQFWGREGQPGEEGIAVTKGRKRTKVRLVERVNSFIDKYKGNQKSEVWRFEDVNPVRTGPYRRYADEAPDPVAASVVQRYLERAV